MLGYELIDYDGIHYYYCEECWINCRATLKYMIADIILEPFICEGCNNEIERSSTEEVEK